MSDPKDQNELLAQLINDAVNRRDDTPVPKVDTSPEELLNFAPRPKRGRPTGGGYSQKFIKRVMEADPMHPGVKLARLCIERDISVRRVSTDIKVSRPTVYNWFVGTQYPSVKQLERVKDLLLTYAALGK